MFLVIFVLIKVSLHGFWTIRNHEKQAIPLASFILTMKCHQITVWQELLSSTHMATHKTSSWRMFVCVCMYTYICIYTNYMPSFGSRVIVHEWASTMYIFLHSTWHARQLEFHGYSIILNFENGILILNIYEYFFIVVLKPNLYLFHHVLWVLHA